MARMHTDRFFPNNHVSISDLLRFVAGFVFAFGFTACLAYVMLKEVRQSLSIKALAAGMRGRRRR